MMISALLVATLPIAVTGDADIINACHYCARLNMKRHAFSLNSHMRLFAMDVGNSI
jgi:hypothetical protein